MRARRAFSPFAGSGRRTIAAILATFALLVGDRRRPVDLGHLPIAAPGDRARDRGPPADARRALREGGAPRPLRGAAPIPGRRPPSSGRARTRSSTAARAGGKRRRRRHRDLGDVRPGRARPARAGAAAGRDLTATGSAILAGRPVTVAARRRTSTSTSTDPIARLRILSDLTSNVSLNAARTIAANADHNLSELIVIQVALGVAGLSVSLLLALALVAATRRHTAHFRSLVSASTDLVLVFGEDGCRYVSDSVVAIVGARASEMLGDGSCALRPPGRPRRGSPGPVPGPGRTSSSSG